MTTQSMNVQGKIEKFEELMKELNNLLQQKEAAGEAITDKENFLQNGTIAAYLIALGQTKSLAELMIQPTIVSLKIKNNWQDKKAVDIEADCHKILSLQSNTKRAMTASVMPWKEAMDEARIAISSMETQILDAEKHLFDRQKKLLVNERKLLTEKESLREEINEPDAEKIKVTETLLKITEEKKRLAEDMDQLDPEKIKFIETILKKTLALWLSKDSALQAKSGINSIERLDLSKEAEQLYSFFKKIDVKSEAHQVSFAADVSNIMKYLTQCIGMEFKQAPEKVEIKHIFQNAVDRILRPLTNENDERRKRWAKLSLIWPDAASYYRSSEVIENISGPASSDVNVLKKIQEIINIEKGIQPFMVDEGIKVEWLEALRVKFKEPAIQIYRTKVAEDLISGKDVRKGVNVFRWTQMSNVTPGLEETPLVVEVNGKSYQVSKLRRTDPRGFYIGKETECCQYISGNSENCVLDGYSNPNAGFIVVKDSENNLVAQCYCWLGRDKTELCFDSYEHNAKGRPIAQALLTKIGEGLVQRFGYTKVSVGTKGATEDAKITKDSFKAHDENIDYISYDGVPFYEDSSIQFIITRNEPYYQEFEKQIKRLTSLQTDAITDEDKVFIGSLLDTRKTKSLARIIQAHNPLVINALIEEMFSKDKLKARLKDNFFYCDATIIQTLLGNKNLWTCLEDKEVAAILHENWSDSLLTTSHQMIWELNAQLKAMLPNIAVGADIPAVFDQLKKTYEQYDHICDLLLGPSRYLTYFQNFEEFLAQQYFLKRNSTLRTYIDGLDEFEKNKIFTQNVYRYIICKEDVEFLMNRGLDINGKDSHGISPLYFSCLNQDLPSAYFLLFKNAMVSAVFHELNEESLSVAFYLIAQAQKPKFGFAPWINEVIDFIITNKANNQFNPDEKGTRGTLLYNALEYNDIRTVKSLINQEANLDPAFNNMTETLLQSLYLVSQISNDPEAKALFQALYNRVTSNNIIITEEEIAKDPSLKTLYKLLKMKHDIHEQDKDKKTLLYHAMINYDINLMVDLMIQGVDINPAYNGFEKTWLQYLYDASTYATEKDIRHKAKRMFECLILGNQTISSITDDNERLALEKIGALKNSLNEQNTKKRTLFYFAYKNVDLTLMNQLIALQVNTDLIYNGITNISIEPIIADAKDQRSKTHQSSQICLDNLFDALYGTDFSAKNPLYLELASWLSSQDSQMREQYTKAFVVLYFKQLSDEMDIQQWLSPIEKLQTLIDQPNVSLSLEKNPKLQASFVQMLFYKLNYLYKKQPVSMETEQKLFQLLQQVLLKDARLNNNGVQSDDKLIGATLFDNEYWIEPAAPNRISNVYKQFVQIMKLNRGIVSDDITAVSLETFVYDTMFIVSDTQQFSRVFLGNVFDVLYGTSFSVNKSLYAEVALWLDSVDSKVREQYPQYLVVANYNEFHDDHDINHWSSWIDKLQILASQPGVSFSLKANPQLQSSFTKLIFAKLDYVNKIRPNDQVIKDKLLQFLAQILKQDKRLIHDVLMLGDDAIKMVLLEDSYWKQPKDSHLPCAVLKQFLQILVDNGVDLTERYFSKNDDLAYSLVSETFNQVPRYSQSYYILRYDWTLFDFLVEQGMSVNRKMAGGETLLTKAIRKSIPEVIDKLLTSHVNYDQTYNGLHEPLIVWALKRLRSTSYIRRREAYAHLVETYLNSLNNVNERYSDSETPLYAIIRYGDVKHLETLLAKGASIFVTNDKGLTPLAVALQRGNWDMVQCLLMHAPELVNDVAHVGALCDPSYDTDASVTTNQYTNGVSCFLSQDTNIREQYSRAFTGFYCNQFQDFIQIRRWAPLLEGFELLAHQPNANFSLADNSGIEEPIVKVIFDKLDKLHKKRPLDPKIETQLFQLLKQLVSQDKRLGNDIVKAYNVPALVFVLHRYGKPPLNHLKWDALVNFVHVLVESGVDLNRHYSKKSHQFPYSFLQVAFNLSFTHDLTLFDYLLAHGAPINEKMRGGVTLLKNAMDKSSPVVIEKLLTHGVDYDPKYNQLTEPLIVWALKKLNSDAECDIENRAAFTQLVDTYLHYLKEVNELYNDSEAIIYAVIKYGDDHQLKTLLARGASITVTDREGKTPLEVALQEGRWDMVNGLLAEHPELIDYRDQAGNSLLHKVISHEKRETLIVQHLLILQPALLMKGNNYNRTPLHLAAFYGSKELVELLLESGARNTTIASNDKPSDIAKTKAIEETLLDYERKHYASDESQLGSQRI